jgi:hypothetical protein
LQVTVSRRDLTLPWPSSGRKLSHPVALREVGW